MDAFKEEEEDPLSTPGREPMEETVKLERLPRPVHEMNCRQARTYLVKLLRCSNGGQNPHYGNPDMKPPFWPDYYWPWTKLTDVHTKPRGMYEPLQYSEMMKLAISRGYQYFGYDPITYTDRSLDNKDTTFRPTIASVVSIPEGSDPSNLQIDPPKLFRPLSKMNCVHARKILAKLLRYQQMGNNPVYGNPETRPPWWPDDCIRWVDMVDLRGKPPYLPDTKSYTDVLKTAIYNAYKYYGVNPETYVVGNSESRSKSPPGTKGPAWKQPSESPPPKLPIPVNKLNCGGARTALSRLLRYQAGNQPPNYGNPLFMPLWWPNDIIDWSQVKNLSHRYEGYLGNSYSNCLRIALIRGYAFYGYDANVYVDDPNGGSSVTMSHQEENIVIEPTIYQEEEEDEDDNEKESTEKLDKEKKNITESFSNNRVLKGKKRMPTLLPLATIDFSLEGNETYSDYSPELLERSDWYPPKLRYDQAIISPEISNSLKRCKVVLNRQTVPYSTRIHGKKFLYPQRPELMEAYYEDLKCHKLTDITIVSSDRIQFHVHRAVLGAQSELLKILLLENEDSIIVIPDIQSNVLELLIQALYTGEVHLTSPSLKKDFQMALKLFQSFGLLSNLISGLSPRISNFEGNGERKKMPSLLNAKSMEGETSSFFEEKEEYKYERRISSEFDESSQEENKLKRSISNENDELEEKPRKLFRRKKKEANKPCLDILNQKILNELSQKEPIELASFLMETRFIHSEGPNCTGCGKIMTLCPLSSNIDHVAWFCTSHDHRYIHSKGVSIRVQTVFEGSSDTIVWIMRVLYCWITNASLQQCSDATGAAFDTVFSWYDKFRDYFGVVEKQGT